MTQNLKQKSKQKIHIVDCDYLYGTSNIPNYKAMKLSSYHKQLGDYVSFITEEYQLTGKHTILYLLRELRHTPFPPGDIVDDYRTVLIGKEFAIFEDVQEIPVEAAICRPDYGIYKYKEPNKYDKASFVQFFQSGKALKNMQDWKRVDSKSVFIVDENFWDASPDAIVKALSTLKEERNILFLHPIKLKKLLDDNVLNAFVSLKLAKFYKIKYNNNIGEDYESVIKAIDILHKLKKEFVYLNISSIPVKIITKDHWADRTNILYDYERCLKIMTYAQKKRVRINFKYPRLRLSSPSWQYFEFFKTWGNHYHTLSYIEALMKGSTEFFHQSYAAILNNKMLWTTAKIKQAVYLLVKHRELMLEYGFTGWGGVFSTTSNLIDYKYIEEKAIEDHLL